MRTLLTLLAIGALSHFATASIIPIDDNVEFCYGTAGLQSSFTAEVGQTLAVDVYLYEFGSPAAAFLLQQNDGLVAAGVKLMRTSSGPSEPAYVAGVGDIAPNASFSEVLPYSPITFATPDVESGLTESMHYTSLSGVQPVVLDANTVAVFLGTFTFTIGSVPGEVTQILITDNDDSVFDTVTFAPEVPLDDVICDFRFEITAVPEPASMSLMLLGSLAALARKRR